MSKLFDVNLRSAARVGQVAQLHRLDPALGIDAFDSEHARAESAPPVTAPLAPRPQPPPVRPSAAARRSYATTKVLAVSLIAIVGSIAAAWWWSTRPASL